MSGEDLRCDVVIRGALMWMWLSIHSEGEMYMQTR